MDENLREQLSMFQKSSWLSNSPLNDLLPVDRRRADAAFLQKSKVRSFHLNGRRIDIKNAAIESLNSVMGPWRKTVADVKHGHTYSPIEQTKDYVESRVTSKIDSYDVEQNLIAETIAKHNKMTKAPVSFVAINLITDKPSSFTHDWKSDHDLSRVNYELKSDARKRAVDMALLSVRTSTSILKNLNIITCDRAFAP